MKHINSCEQPNKYIHENLKISRNNQIPGDSGQPTLLTPELTLVKPLWEKGN